MKTTAAAAAAAVVVGAALALLGAPLATAERDASIHLRVSHGKFYVTPMGHQCAYNNCVDPSVYPCQGGACVRLNYSYGVCDTNSAAGSDDRPENEKFPCPYPNPYADVPDDDSDESGSFDDEDESEADEADEDEDDEDEQ